MIVGGSLDSICPISFIQSYVSTCNSNENTNKQEGEEDLCELFEVNVNHFELYGGEWFEKISDKMVQFVAQKTGL